MINQQLGCVIIYIRSVHACMEIGESSEARDCNRCHPATSSIRTSSPHCGAFYCRILPPYLYRFHGWILAGVVETTHTMCFNRTFLHWLQWAMGRTYTTGAKQLGLEELRRRRYTCHTHTTPTSYIFISLLVFPGLSLHLYLHRTTTQNMYACTAFCNWPVRLEYPTALQQQLLLLYAQEGKSCSTAFAAPIEYANNWPACSLNVNVFLFLLVCWEKKVLPFLCRLYIQLSTGYAASLSILQKPVLQGWLWRCRNSLRGSLDWLSLALWKFSLCYDYMCLR
jgi:hypothetical protein